MIEHGAADAMRLSEAQALSRAVRQWKEMFEEAIAARGPVAEEDAVEYVVGYLEPPSSWAVVATEMARSFPGATARLEEILGDLERFLDQVAAREELLRCAEDVLVCLRRSLAGMRSELVPRWSGLAGALEDFEDAFEQLAGLVPERHLDRRGTSAAVPTSPRYARIGLP